MQACSTLISGAYLRYEMTLTSVGDKQQISIRKGGSVKMNCCHVKNQCLLIRLPKEIDHCQAEQIRQECERSFMNFIIRDIIFDFSDTSFMDSSGIGLILGRVRQIHPINGKVYLFGENEIIRKMLEMSGVQNVVTVLDTIEEVKEVYE